MAYHFEASRVTGGNAVFPDQIIIDVDNETLTYRKKNLIGYEDVKLRFGAIGCVSRSAGLVFCDVIIETNGGRTIRAKGFTRSDAEEIVDLLS